MLASSVFVLTALTMTGIFMQKEKKEEQDQGYTLDLTGQEIVSEKKQEQKSAESEGELDYMPLEADSDKIQIPGLTDVVGEKDPKKEKKSYNKFIISDNSGTLLQGEIDAVTEVDTGLSLGADSAPGMEENVESLPQRELHFSREAELLRPVQGEVLLPFSMDGSVYFETLDQYKYHPAVLLQATAEEEVCAAAAGQVTGVKEDPQLGLCLTMDLGDGYQLTYGQLKALEVMEGSLVEQGMPLAKIAQPTKYYSEEGSHLYLQLTKDGSPVNPEEYFR